jgi:hypothetical protein
MPIHALAGSLSTFSLAHVLRLLQATRATGHLELEHDDECTDLFIEDGRSLFARTTGAALRVGDILVRRGDLRPEAIEFVLAFQQDQPGVRLGRMLVDNGVLSEAQIRDALLAVQRHIVVAALKWRHGTFRFGPEERLIGEDVRLDLDVDELLAWPQSAAKPQVDRPRQKKAA